MERIFDRPPARAEVLGVPIDPWTMVQTVESIERIVASGGFAHIIGVNADKLLQMRDNPEMDAIVRRCEVVNADGASMVIAAKKLGVFVPERVAGVDLMWELCMLAERRSYSVYLLGAKAEVVEKAVSVIAKKHSALKIAGFRDGYFTNDEFDSIVAEVSATHPNIVFVGITSPKKEQLIERFRELGATGAYIGVGGTFDVVSGNIPRAPIWMQLANLEWLFRMAQEPKRLIRRYTIGNARFYRILRKEMRTRKKINA